MTSGSSGASAGSVQAAKEEVVWPYLFPCWYIQCLHVEPFVCAQFALGGALASGSLLQGDSSIKKGGADQFCVGSEHSGSYFRAMASGLVGPMELHRKCRCWHQMKGETGLQAGSCGSLPFLAKDKDW